MAGQEILGAATAAEVASEYHILYSGLTGTGKTAGQTCVILCGIQVLRPSGQSHYSPQIGAMLQRM